MRLSTVIDSARFVALAGSLILSGCDLSMNMEDAFENSNKPHHWDQLPMINAPRLVRAVQTYPESLRIYAYDPDGTPIDSLVADLRGLPDDNDASFIKTEDYRGTLRWTPTENDSGGYDVLFTAGSSGRSITDTTTIYVTDHLSDLPPTLFAPADTVVTVGDTLCVHIYAEDPDGDPIFSWRVKVDRSWYFFVPFTFVASPSKSQATLTWRVVEPDTVTFTFSATNFLTGSATMRVMMPAAEPAQGLSKRNSGLAEP